MTSNDSLIILVNNQDNARSHQHLAKHFGEEQAGLLYHKFMVYTKEITKQLNCDKLVYYSSHVNHNDLWDNMLFDKHLQEGSDQGERMQNAFADQFSQSKNRVVIISTECMEIETYMIKEAFAVLENNDVVIGPSKNGGYYLLGMKKFYPTLFENKEWNSENLLMDTLLDLKKMQGKYYLMKTLNDIMGYENLDQINPFPEQKPEDWF